jgi:cytoskeletal protein CcmA (bactofilin family)
MSIFNNAKPASQERPPVRPDPMPQTASDSTISVIGPGLRIIGDVETAGVIKVEGLIDGSIRGARQLILGKGGQINGDINATEAVLGGKVVGTITTTERVEVQATSSVEGDIHTKSIVVFEGGIINGSVRMGDSAPPPAKNSASRPAEKSMATPAAAAVGS